jgi:hypothetical protein
MKKELARQSIRDGGGILYCLLSLVLFFLPPDVYGEVPPPVYEELKLEAGEYLKIEITSAGTKDGGECRVGIAYSAVVLSVIRSNSGLKAGDKIEINSWSMKDSPSCVGGGPKAPKLLAAGWVGEAFLSQAEESASVFYPAAYGESFVDMAVEQQ